MINIINQFMKRRKIMNNYRFKRVFILVLDSLGIGKARDAAEFSDLGSNTFKSIEEKFTDFKISNLEQLGWGDFDDYKNLKKVDHIHSYTLRAHEKSQGKDTMTGHWELMGLKVTKSFKTFTNTGFPDELLDLIKAKTGRGILGNVAASGTEIIKELGEEHMKTGKLIVYTSADSVLQIAAHEKIVSVPELYDICEFVRKITLKDEWKVGRIIARPFIGTNPNDFKRTSNRHDYALSPNKKTYLNYLSDNGFDVIAVGKINDIFNGSGVTESYKTKSNEDGMNRTIDLTKKDFTGLCFTNLVDFDMEYGHRRDPIGYGRSIEEFDKKLPELLNNLQEEDLLILTADHGNDPTFEGSDHTRENVPVIFYSKGFTKGKYLGESDSFAVVGATVAENFKIDKKTLLKRNVYRRLI